MGQKAHAFDHTKSRRSILASILATKEPEDDGVRPCSWFPVRFSWVPIVAGCQSRVIWINLARLLDRLPRPYGVANVS